MQRENLVAFKTFSPYRDFFKRIFDFIFSMVALIVLAIPMLFIAMMIKWNDPAEPVIFKQKRVGKNNKPFTIYKYRTMVKNAPHQMATTDFKHPEKYTTNIGRFLRKSSLDELPQLFNVLKGDMSIIGPRPLIPSEKEVLKIRTELGATRVLPGVTGLSQVHGRDELIGAKKAQIDAAYANKVNIFLDLIILFQTLFYVIRGSGING